LDRWVIPHVGYRFSDVFSPITPLNADGSRTEPPVSLPIAIGTILSATATALPEEDPPGI